LKGITILFNGEEVAEVYFEYINRHVDTEQTEECNLQFHADLIRKSATQTIRSRRTPIWRGLKTLAFSVDSDIFKYEGIDKNGKKIVTVIIPFAQINSIQTWSRRIKKPKTKSEMKTLDATTVQDLR
jgi:hypothetical protein